jgi:hypothetical protein
LSLTEAIALSDGFGIHNNHQIYFLLAVLNIQIIFAAHLVFKVTVWLFQKLKGNQVKNLNSTRCCEYHILTFKLKSIFVSTLCH